MQTTIPMFSKNITQYKWKKRTSPVANLKQLMQLPANESPRWENKIRANTSYDVLIKDPLYQTQFQAVKQNEPIDSKFHITNSLFKVRKTSVPIFETDDQHLEVSNGKPLVRQSRGAFLKDSKLHQSKSIAGLNNSTQINSSLKLLHSISVGKIDAHRPNAFALSHTLHASPKWSQVREKNLRYPHIC